MKRIFYAISLLFFFGLSSKAESPHQIAGLYFSPEYGIRIEVEHHRNKLKIRGLESNRRWETFRRIDRRVWKDRRGNEFVLGRRSQLIYRKNRRSRYQRNSTIHFYKSVKRSYIRDWGRSNYYDSWTDDSSRDRFKEDRRYEGRSYSSRTPITGLWYSSDFRLQMEIEATSTGIRCKLENENKWTYYRNSDDNVTWKDEKGNILRMSDRNILLWISRNGKRKIPLKRNSSR